MGILDIAHCLGGIYDLFEDDRKLVVEYSRMDMQEVEYHMVEVGAAPYGHKHN